MFFAPLARVALFLLMLMLALLAGDLIGHAYAAFCGIVAGALRWAR